MKIACITAGAGRMYCGSCLRDNTLAKALLDAGHDVLLIPTYMPTRTDELNVSSSRIFLGGINIYLQQHFGFFRRSPHLVDRLLDSKPLLNLTTRLGMSVDPALLGELTVSMVRGIDGALRKEIEKLARYIAREIKPEIVNLPNSMLISLAPAIKAEMNVPICCTLQGEDLFLEGLVEPFRTRAIEIIRKQTPYVDAFISVSAYGAESMAGYLGIDRDRIHVVPLGINFDGFGRADTGDGLFTIGYLARIAPEKGLRFLCDAYHVLRTRNSLPSSRLWAAGYLAPEHKPYLAGIQTDLASRGLADHFSYHGELNRIGKQNYLRSLSVFSVPEIYAEPKGLFLLEALASGVPVVQPRRGAFCEIVENTGGGILVEPDNPAALAEGILELWNDPKKRTELGRRGYEGVRNRYSASGMAKSALEVYKLIMGNR